MIHQLLLSDHLTRTVGKVDQDVEGPAAKGQRLALTPKHPVPARKLKGAKLQISMNIIVSHGSWHGLSVRIRAKLKRAFLIDISLIGLSAGSFAQKGSARGDRRRDACSQRCLPLPSR